MTSRLVIFFFLTAFGSAAFAEEATLVADARLEFAKGKGFVVLKTGAVVDVVGKDGDGVIVIYRKIQGRIPLKSINLPANTPEIAEANKTAAAPLPAAPASKAVAAKPSESPKPAEATKPATGSSNQPTTMYGKAVKKARDNEAQHKETIVNPTNEVTAPKN